MSRPGKQPQIVLIVAEPLENIVHGFPRVVNIVVVSPEIADFHCSGVIGLQATINFAHFGVDSQDLRPTFRRQESCRRTQWDVQSRSNTWTFPRSLKEWFRGKTTKFSSIATFFHSFRWCVAPIEFQVVDSPFRKCLSVQLQVVNTSRISPACFCAIVPVDAHFEAQIVHLKTAEDLIASHFSCMDGTRVSFKRSKILFWQKCAQSCSKNSRPQRKTIEFAM